MLHQDLMIFKLQTYLFKSYEELTSTERTGTRSQLLIPSELHKSHKELFTLFQTSKRNSKLFIYLIQSL